MEELTRHVTDIHDRLHHRELEKAKVGDASPVIAAGGPGPEAEEMGSVLCLLSRFSLIWQTGSAVR